MRTIVVLAGLLMLGCTPAARLRHTPYEHPVLTLSIGRCTASFYGHVESIYHCGMDLTGTDLNVNEKNELSILISRCPIDAELSKYRVRHFPEINDDQGILLEAGHSRWYIPAGSVGSMPQLVRGIREFAEAVFQRNHNRSFFLDVTDTTEPAAPSGRTQPLNPAPTFTDISRSTGSWSTVFGETWNWNICESDFAKEPFWEGPGTSVPPISLDDAIRISREQLQLYYPRHHQWIVTDAGLKSVCCPRHWFYSVEWLPSEDSLDTLDIAVMLSGRPVKLSPGPVIDHCATW